MKSKGAKKGDSRYTKKFLGYGWEIHGLMLKRYWKKRTCRRRDKDDKNETDNQQ